ncbi:MAG TPA: alpha/beta fold hydrolase [Pelobium sp.]|nr:alpha/beta fold hydrolase [Pelobium sp.]
MIKAVRYIVLLVLIQSMFLLAVGYAQSKNGYDFYPVNRKIQGWVGSGYYNGASLMVAKNNQIIFEKYYGNYRPETITYIASAGKWLAAATIAALVDEGKLSWNDKVIKWLPEFTDEKGEATLRQLLSHTSGYPDYQPKGERPDNYQTLKESVAHIVSLPADTLPGTKFKYGGLSMQVAGRMAELATGKNWEQIFQEKIAIPLLMKYTHFTPVDETPGHNPMLAGGARTSLQDYMNFLQMIANDGVFNGSRILSKQAIDEMQANQIGNALVNSGEFVENVRASLRKDIYGLGEWREEADKKGNAVLISSPSWAGAYPWIDKTTNTYGFFLARVAQMKNGFNPFLASPVLPLLVRDVYKKAKEKNVKSGYITTKDGAKIYYEEKGQGDPLILIHGHSFDHQMWDNQFDFFAKNYRTIRYDLRGYGRSSMFEEGKPFMHQQDLLELMNTLKIKKAHLVGLSLGGFVATDFLAVHQNRLLSATMASGDIYNMPGPDVPWTAEEILRRKAEIENYKKQGIDANKRKWFDALTIRNSKVLENIRRPVWDAIYKWDAWQPLHIEPRLLFGTSVIPMLKKLKVTIPVLILTGEADSGKQNKLLPLIPSAKQVFIKDAGHMSNLENPNDFNRKVLDFLSSVHNK